MPASGQIKAAALRASRCGGASHDQASRRTLFLRALGQCLRGDGLMYENAALSCLSQPHFLALVFSLDLRRAGGGSGSKPKMLRKH
ncbi:MAG: hypothetical protein HPY61_13840 [Methanotrichaceae archaeon]|nr:hypothetical protein [Methanotrichaceae archaeon]